MFIRVAVLLMTMISAGASAMDKLEITLAPQLLKDSGGLEYIGYGVDEQQLRPYLSQLKAHVGEVTFTQLRHNQAARDHHSFHITLINPFEHPDIASIKLTDIPHVKFELVGLGHAKKIPNQTFFVVVNSTVAQQVRARYQLKAKDLHITLGFDKTDVFGVSKGVDSLLVK